MFRLCARLRVNPRAYREAAGAEPPSVSLSLIDQKKNSPGAATCATRVRGIPYIPRTSICFALMDRAVGFEPTHCQDGSLVPYRLATPAQEWSRECELMPIGGHFQGRLFTDSGCRCARPIGVESLARLGKTIARKEQERLSRDRFASTVAIVAPICPSDPDAGFRCLSSLHPRCCRLSGDVIFCV